MNIIHPTVTMKPIGYPTEEPSVNPNPTTPADVLKDLINTKRFVECEETRHQCVRSYWRTPINGIDVIKFGNYFNKCIGGLNSIMKKADVNLGDSKQFVVKKTVGVRKIDVQGIPHGNAKYATIDSVFKFLHEKHIPLVCKKEKRKMISDFYAIKERALNDYKNIIEGAYEFIPDNILIADAYELMQRRPTYYGAGTTFGHIVTNERFIPKKDIELDLHFGSLYNDYNTVVDNHRCHGYTNDYYKRSPNRLTIDCIVNEKNTEIGHKVISLFTVNVINQQRDSPTQCSLTAYNTQFNDFDVTALTDYVVFEIDKLHSKFEDDLERVKEKYISEYILSELCDSDESAI
jgi:hypothetical protein